MDIYQLLSQAFLFQSLDAEQIEVVEACTSLRQVAKGEHVFNEGQPATAFYIMVSGMVKIYKLSAGGNEKILHIQLAGDLVAEAVIFEFDTYPAYCQALENTQLLRFSKEKFLDVLRCFPEITFHIMRAYSRRIRQLVDKIDEISLRDVRSRLANFLLTNSKTKNGKLSCTLNFSKKDLSAMLGTIPETLSRALNFLKKEGFIEESGNSILIVSKAGLEQVSGG
ncbi:MAG TPA: Crp/Fnr family transcriptional regulator [bacterium]|nr:Crp/Fnr family transcriptional regulator [bacterium]